MLRGENRWRRARQDKSGDGLCLDEVSLDGENCRLTKRDACEQIKCEETL